MKSFLPFEIKYSPIKKLALIPFEKSPDIIYRGFELQFIDGAPYGVGYRVIAYRNDNYVDVYDDSALNYLEDEAFNVAENGLHQHVLTSINNVQFCNVDNNQIICFEFVDIQGRQIQVKIKEKTKRKTKPMNLLAPIGVGSKNPKYLPVFFMYNFDFIRKRKSTISCKIDGKEFKIDKFPLPMNGQSRLYARYSNECELLEFVNTDISVLREIELNEENVYYKDNEEYIFERNNVLKCVILHFEQRNVEICFEPSLDLTKSCSGLFTIKPRPQMGYLQGEYSVQLGKCAVIEMIPKDGWVSNPNSFLTRMILGKNSVFCTWSKKYKYKSIINYNTKEIQSNWINGNVN